VIGGEVVAADIGNDFDPGAWSALAAPDAVTPATRRVYKLAGNVPATLAVVWA
jgi:hypothetical protein